jgi:hypothetical protein
MEAAQAQEAIAPRAMVAMQKIFSLDDPKSIDCQGCLINEAALSQLIPSSVKIPSGGKGSGSSKSSSSKSSSSSCSGYCVLRCAAGGEARVVLSLRPCPWVEAGALLAPQWVLDWLSMAEGQGVEVEFVATAADITTTTDTTANAAAPAADAAAAPVSARLVGVLNNLHFDEYTQPGAFFLPVAWRAAQPGLCPGEVRDAVRGEWLSGARPCPPPFLAAGSLVGIEYHALTMVGAVFAV